MDGNNNTQKPIVKEKPKNNAIIADFEALYNKAIKRGVGFSKGTKNELQALKKGKDFTNDNKYLLNIVNECERRMNITISEEIKKFIKK